MSDSRVLLERIAELRQGHDRTREIAPAELQVSALRLTSDPADLVGADFFIITVPTPIDATRDASAGSHGTLQRTRHPCGTLARKLSRRCSRVTRSGRRTRNAGALSNVVGCGRCTVKSMRMRSSWVDTLRRGASVSSSTTRSIW